MVVDRLLAASGLPRSEALLLLSHVTGWRRERLIAASRDPLADEVVVSFRALAERRVAGEPIAYLVGQREFFGRTFHVDADVLIPRPETESLVDVALRWIDAHAAARVLDLGTGSGAIAVTLALERAGLDVVATDVSTAAIAVARRNAARLDATVRFATGSWYDALAADARFDVIVSNPPYIAAGDRHLVEGDLRFEPIVALTDQGDGFQALRRIVGGASSRLAIDGLLAVEHGHDQAGAVRASFVAAGFVDVTSQRDLAGIERVTFGRRHGSPPADAPS